MILINGEQGVRNKDQGLPPNVPGGYASSLVTGNGQLATEKEQQISCKVLILIITAHFDYVILVAPIWAGRIATPLKAFIKSLHEKIGKYSFITLCGSVDNRKVVSELTSLTGRKPFKLLEISANDLAPAGTSVKQGSSYRVTEKDLLKVDKG